MTPIQVQSDKVMVLSPYGSEPVSVPITDIPNTKDVHESTEGEAEQNESTVKSILNKVDVLLERIKDRSKRRKLEQLQAFLKANDVAVNRFITWADAVAMGGENVNFATVIQHKYTKRKRRKRAPKMMVFVTVSRYEEEASQMMRDGKSPEQIYGRVQEVRQHGVQVFLQDSKWQHPIALTLGYDADGRMYCHHIEIDAVSFGLEARQYHNGLA